MKDSAYKISLDINEHGSQVVLKAKKSDTGRTVHISLRAGGTPYTIEEDCHAAFRAAKPDGTMLYNACTIENNEIVYEFTEQTCSAIGRSRCEIALYGPDDKLITTSRFAILVDDTIDQDDVVEDQDEFSELTYQVWDTLRVKEDTIAATRDANSAATRATEATQNANEATEAATQAAQAANEAAESANNATDAADQAAGNASGQAQVAGDAADSAYQAAYAANQAAQTANGAAENANEAAQNANTASKLAEQAATTASGNAQFAVEAADNANSAAYEANKASESANEATLTANEAAQAANGAANDANLATENANETVTNVVHIVKNTMAAGEVSGESVSMDDAVNFGFIGCRIFGKTTQDGTPTPDAPVELVSVGDSGSITVSVTGDHDAQSMTLATPNGLPGIPVASGGNYTDANGQQWICDEIDFDRGVYVKRTSVKMFNGAEAYADYTADTGVVSVQLVHRPATKSLCTHGTHGTEYFWANDNFVGFRVAHFGVTTLNGFSAFLAERYESGNPVTIRFVTTAPIETPLSEEELAAYASLHTYRGNTTVSNDASAHMEIEYIVDAKKYIDSRISSALVEATVE